MKDKLKDEQKEGEKTGALKQFQPLYRFEKTRKAVIWARSMVRS